ncbi:MAG: electron transfer flavoprotein subunit alpha/FixB family protein [Pyramidobacter sp.]|nr:electron transfer flavoprotein subunit alpha/FixB family protein [Pyramidobacter sp.]
MKEYWVWCGISAQGIDPETSVLIKRCRELAGNEAKVCLAVVTEEKMSFHPELAAADIVRWCSISGSAWLRADVLTEMVRRYEPEIILFPSDVTNAQIAARAAALLETGLSADCTDLRMENGLLIMHRPAFGGGVLADIVCRIKRPQMATVRPGALPAPKIVNGSAVWEEYSPVLLPDDPIELVSRTIVEQSRSLRDAKIVVSGGLGIENRANYGLIEELAAAIGGEAGASRAAVDAGFAPWRNQVGQTGTTVNPDLYIAFGISGSIQHISGMHGAKYIVSVNTDPKAPIFDYSDLAVIADWRKTAEYLLKQLK